MGYQGWFNCPGDGSQVNGYFHWFKNNIPDAAHFRVDMWPDTSELPADERCATKLRYADGQPAYLYSAYNATTVRRHFEWMSQYGVDGVFVQRFGSELADPAHFDTRNVVTQNARAGAEDYGRVFAIMYDTSGMDSATFVDRLEADWKYLVDVLQVTDSPAYLHHNGKPVVAIWGLGFTEHPGTPAATPEGRSSQSAAPPLRLRPVTARHQPAGGRPGGRHEQQLNGQDPVLGALPVEHRRDERQAHHAEHEEQEQGGHALHRHRHQPPSEPVDTWERG